MFFFSINKLKSNSKSQPLHCFLYKPPWLLLSNHQVFSTYCFWKQLNPIKNEWKKCLVFLDLRCRKLLLSVINISHFFIYKKINFVLKWLQFFKHFVKQFIAPLEHKILSRSSKRKTSFCWRQTDKKMKSVVLLLPKRTRHPVYNRNVL